MPNSEIKISCKSIKVDDLSSLKMEGNQVGIKLFKIKISEYISYLSQLKAVLNTTEIERSKRFYHDNDRNRFIVSRALLKFILASEASVEVDKIQLDKKKNKKPYLVSYPHINFNVSHSNNYAVIALSSKEVGVDVEFISKNFDFSEIMPTVFNKLELNSVLGASDKNKAFYRYWTRKEAVVKATGKGVDDSLINIPVSDGFHVLECHVLEIPKNMGVVSFSIDTDYIASVAQEGVGDFPISFYQVKTFIKDLINLT